MPAKERGEVPSCQASGWTPRLGGCERASDCQPGLGCGPRDNGYPDKSLECLDYCEKDEDGFDSKIKCLPLLDPLWDGENEVRYCRWRSITDL